MEALCVYYVVYRVRFSLWDAIPPPFFSLKRDSYPEVSIVFFEIFCRYRNTPIALKQFKFSCITFQPSKVDACAKSFVLLKNPYLFIPNDLYKLHDTKSPYKEQSL